MRDWKSFVESYGYKYLRTDKNNIYYSKDGWDFVCNKYKFPPKKVAIKNCLTPEPYVISLMREKHNDKYGYDKFNWSGSVSDYSTFYCPEHGYFNQIVNNHLKGYGCFDCNGSKKLEIDDVIRRCEDYRGDKYDYSEISYDHNSNKITVKCREHGKFSTNLYSHLKGSDCMKCYLKTKFGSRLSTEDFLNKSKLIHGDRYDYSLVDYISSKTKVKIICKDHGVFEQVPNYHLSGNGCQKCGSECVGFNKTAYINSCPNGSNIYIFKINSDTEDFIKVGISKNIERRINLIKYESNYTVELIYSKFFDETSILFDLEKKVHRDFKYFKHRPKTYFSGLTECYENYILDSLISNIDNFYNEVYNG